MGHKRSVRGGAKKQEGGVGSDGVVSHMKKSRALYRIMAEKCNECLFTEGRIVSARRMKEIVTNARKKDSFFVCHKASIKDQTVVCRGYYDSQPPSQLERIAGRLGMVEFILEEDDL